MASTKSRKPAKPKDSKKTTPRRGEHERSDAAGAEMEGSGSERVTDDQLYQRIAQILEQARGQVARAVNTAMVHAYWNVGREIVEVEQAGELRAGYGEELIARLSMRLRWAYGKGFSVPNLRNMRQFYVAFPKGSALHSIRSTLSSESSAGKIHSTLSSGSSGRKIRPALTTGSEDAPQARGGFPSELSWSYYLVLMRVPREQGRAFYEIEAARECWSVRQLERQIGALLFDRLAKHRNPEEVLALARKGQEVSTPDHLLRRARSRRWLLRWYGEREDGDHGQVSRRASIRIDDHCGSAPKPSGMNAVAAKEDPDARIPAPEERRTCAGSSI